MIRSFRLGWLLLAPLLLLPAWAEAYWEHEALTSAGTTYVNTATRNLSEAPVEDLLVFESVRLQNGYDNPYFHADVNYDISANQFASNNDFNFISHRLRLGFDLDRLVARLVPSGKLDIFIGSTNSPNLPTVGIIGAPSRAERQLTAASNAAALLPTPQANNLLNLGGGGFANLGGFEYSSDLGVTDHFSVRAQVSDNRLTDANFRSATQLRVNGTWSRDGLGSVVSTHVGHSRFLRGADGKTGVYDLSLGYDRKRFRTSWGTRGGATYRLDKLRWDLTVGANARYLTRFYTASVDYSSSISPSSLGDVGLRRTHRVTADLGPGLPVRRPLKFKLQGVSTRASLTAITSLSQVLFSGGSLFSSVSISRSQIWWRDGSATPAAKRITNQASFSFTWTL